MLSHPLVSTDQARQHSSDVRGSYRAMSSNKNTSMARLLLIQQSAARHMLMQQAGLGRTRQVSSLASTEATLSTLVDENVYIVRPQPMRQKASTSFV